MSHEPFGSRVFLAIVEALGSGEAVERLHGMLFINCEGCLLSHRFLDFLMTLL